MAINVVYDIPASMLGAVGLGTGAGVRAERDRVRTEQTALAQQELGQRERLEGNRIAASRANAFLGVAANAASQQYARETAERQRLFDHAAGLADRQQGAQLQGQLAGQQAELQRRRDAEGFGRDVAMETYQAELARKAEEAKQAGRLDFAVREREQQAAEIRRQGELRKQTIRGGIQAGTVRPQDGERRIAAIEDEISMSIGGLSGAEFDVSTLPPTPQEELAASFGDEVYTDDDGNKWVRNKDGVWGPPRGWKPPEDPVKAQKELEAKERETRLKEQSERAKTYRDLLTGFLRQTEKGEPGEPPRPKYSPEKAAEMAADLMVRADRFAYGPDWQGPVQPGQEMPLPGHYAPFGTPDPRPQTPPFDGPAGGETHHTAPAAPASPAAAPGPFAPPRQDPRQARENPIRSLYDLEAFGGAPPADITRDEWQRLGSNIGDDRYVAKLRENGGGADQVPMSELPEAARGAIDQLGNVAYTLPGGTAEEQQTQASFLAVMGATAVFGPDVTRWPREVIADLAADLKTVHELSGAAKVPGAGQQAKATPAQQPKPMAPVDDLMKEANALYANMKEGKEVLDWYPDFVASWMEPDVADPSRHPVEQLGDMEDWLTNLQGTGWEDWSPEQRRDFDRSLRRLKEIQAEVGRQTGRHLEVSSG